MNKLNSIFLFLFLFALLGCRQSADRCKDTVCQNGSVCTGGGCVCPNGYTGQFCETQIPGSVIGKVSPSSVVTGLVLNSTSTADLYQTNIVSQVGFIFSDVPPGSYTLHINTNNDYYPSPPDINVTVTAGSTSDMGVIVLPYILPPQTGIVTFSVNGSPIYTLNSGFQAAYSYPYRNISILGGSDGNPPYSFDLSILSVTEPGNYIVHNASHLRITNQNGVWGANYNGNVVANISSVDTSTFLFSGTFSGTLGPANMNGDTVHISGSFINVYGYH